MKLSRSLALIALALVASIPLCRADQQNDVYYTLALGDPNSSLIDNIFFYNEVDANGNGGSVTGNIPTINYEDGVPQIEDVGNPFNVTATSLGLLGVDQISSGATTDLSVYISINNASTVPINQSFTTFFAPFFAAHTDLVDDESTIVDALGDPTKVDNDTNDDGGQIIYQFRDYVSGLGLETAAPVNGGSFTLVHFSDGTAFGSGMGTQLPAGVPEPSTWATMLLGGLGMLGVCLRRKRTVV